MPPLQTSPIGLDEISEIGRCIFVSQCVTIHEIAEDYDLPALGSTARAVLDWLVDVASRLDDSAFKPQPDDLDGSDVWSAGDVLSHLVAMDLASRPFWEATTGMELETPSRLLRSALDQPPLTAEQGLIAATQLRGATKTTLTLIVAHCTGDERAVHFALGPSNVRAAVLGNCLHTMDHVYQLEALHDVR